MQKEGRRIMKVEDKLNFTTRLLNDHELKLDPEKAK